MGLPQWPAGLLCGSSVCGTFASVTLIWFGSKFSIKALVFTPLNLFMEKLKHFCFLISCWKAWRRFEKHSPGTRAPCTDESLRDPRSVQRCWRVFAAPPAAAFTSPWPLPPPVSAGHAAVGLPGPDGPQLRVGCELSGFHLRPNSDPITGSPPLGAPRRWSRPGSQSCSVKHGPPESTGSSSVPSAPVHPQPLPRPLLPGFRDHPVPRPPPVPSPDPLPGEPVPGPGVLHLLQPVQQRLPVPQDASVQTHLLPGVPGAHQRQVGPAQHHPVSPLPRGHDLARAGPAHADHGRERADLPAGRHAESLQRPLPAQQREAASQKVRLSPPPKNARCKM